MDSRLLGDQPNPNEFGELTPVVLDESTRSALVGLGWSTRDARRSGDVNKFIRIIFYFFSLISKIVFFFFYNSFSIFIF